MLKKVVEKCPATGRLQEKYVNMGPSRALRNHGRPSRTVCGITVGALRALPPERA